MHTHRFEFRISHHQAKQPSHFPTQQLVDYFGIAYDIIRHELSERDSDGTIILKHKHKSGMLYIAIKAKEDDARCAVNALERLGLVSPMKMAA